MEWFHVLFTNAEKTSNQNDNPIRSSLFSFLALFIYGYGRIDSITIVDETMWVYEQPSYDILALLQAMDREYYHFIAYIIAASISHMNTSCNINNPTVSSSNKPVHHTSPFYIPIMKTDAVRPLQVLQSPQE